MYPRGNIRSVLIGTATNTGAGGPPVIILCALSFSSDFDRGTTHMLLFTNQKRKLGHIKLSQGAIQQLDYTGSGKMRLVCDKQDHRSKVIYSPLSEFQVIL